MTDTDLELSSCALAVHDIDEALHFYRDVLGFQVSDDVAPEGAARRVSIHSPAQPLVRIILEAPAKNPDISPADRTSYEELMAKGLLSRLVFATTDCDATFERVAAAGIEVMQEPINRPDGARDCAFLDPSGTMLRFTQPSRADVARGR
ncbi:VOC family protein [Streptomyces sp. NPDC055099]